MPEFLEDVLVAYPPDDGDQRPFVIMGYRDLMGQWIPTGDTEVFPAYQHPLCWMHPGDLPPFPTAIEEGNSR